MSEVASFHFESIANGQGNATVRNSASAKFRYEQATSVYTLDKRGSHGSTSYEIIALAAHPGVAGLFHLIS